MKENKTQIVPVEIREMEIDDLHVVFDIGEQLFTAEKYLNLYRTWDEYTLLNASASDRELCLVAETANEVEAAARLNATRIYEICVV